MKIVRTQLKAQCDCCKETYEDVSMVLMTERKQYMLLCELCRQWTMKILNEICGMEVTEE